MPAMPNFVGVGRKLVEPRAKFRPRELMGCGSCIRFALDMLGQSLLQNLSCRTIRMARQSPVRSNSSACRTK